MGQIRTLEAADGHQFGAWETERGTHPYALVVLQEIFGVNHHIRTVCERFAQAGFHVIAPALFDRAERGVELEYTTDGVQKGLALRAQIPTAKTLLDVQAAARALKARKVGVIGYCWGGTLAWDAATGTDDFAAAVSWYGGGIAAHREETPRCPVQLHFGERDTSIPHADIAAIRAAQPNVELYVYDDAEHGFGCEERASYNAQAFVQAQERSLAFLKSTLNP
ncbi:MAG: dienelactone hydrolase family protein [Acetobacter fabarum]|jgi:carboxymethylenebutenolidase|uniref:dienelactone hydrolase family protein n=1 Tax=Acetobacter fabarum TaxID=483199 RepID=UPI00242B7B7A|nr:dienelactone hydrolase family protein [Acetobacter fabarum]MCH4026201.1 dienelactone hydrolase family protein [Acetobacter fabarum]MCH4054950.1 dienelactone hydrolase family protein [Acetobacter fabarum]MCH4085937.1 dienelactone hydrolase family protein [Acetobacter fabarum]MCH4127471.1 dienelactone hydrolase family protein [Acetobacter fabarum]MCH4136820.1 dienelactone hydrolase family protein [Acetobacter fabarum]